MAKKKGRKRPRKTWSILNAVEAWIYGEILMQGSTGSSILGFFSGAGDLGYGSETIGGITVQGPLQGAGQISLADVMQEPGLAIATVSSNFKNNLLPMSLAAFTTSVTFRVGRRLLRRPLSSVTRNLIKPALGPGVRL